MDAAEVLQWMVTAATALAAYAAWRQGSVAKDQASASDIKAAESNNLSAGANEVARKANALAERALMESVQSNNLSKEANEISRQANDLAKMANELAHDLHSRQTEDHVVRFGWDIATGEPFKTWLAFTNSGQHSARQVVMSIEVNDRKLELKVAEWAPGHVEYIDVSPEAAVQRSRKRQSDEYGHHPGIARAVSPVYLPDGWVSWHAAWLSEAGVRHTAEDSVNLVDFTDLA